MKVALKVNLVSGGKPDSAVVPHPKFVSALCRLLVARGAEVVVGDSPGGLYTAPLCRPRLFRLRHDRRGEVGARLNHDFSQRAVSFPEGHYTYIYSFQYTAWLDGADAIIDVCKLKTHGMMGMSCAVKNLFGVIPGTLKPEYHFRYPNPDDFAAMLVDLADFVRPRLSICDAVVAMEGNGPTAGTPRNVGAVLAAQSPHAPRSRRRPHHRSASAGCAHPSPPPTGAVISPRTRKPFPSPGSCLPSPISIWWRSAVRWNSPAPSPAPSERWRAGPCAA